MALPCLLPPLPAPMYITICVTIHKCYLNRSSNMQCGSNHFTNPTIVCDPATPPSLFCIYVAPGDLSEGRHTEKNPITDRTFFFSRLSPSYVTRWKGWWRADSWNNGKRRRYGVITRPSATTANGISKGFFFFTFPMGTKLNTVLISL